jgi:hypothetical protein
LIYLKIVAINRRNRGIPAAGKLAPPLRLSAAREKR